ncbi:MAG: C4-type zinc ribbon domain-containing protein [Candidatus Atribacteria bacterium]|nr:C4-type zinc ribbon domain-containing protein [Candidatus Atribacteria bacterium]
MPEIHKKLIALQNLDEKIVLSNKKISAKSEEIQRLSEERERDQAEWEEFRKTFNKERVELAHLELELKQIEEKLKKSQGKLYSGDIHSAKELEQWKANMETFEKSKTTLEDVVIGQLDKTEHLQLALKEKQARLHTRTNDIEHSLARLKQEIGELKTNVEHLSTNRRDAFQVIPVGTSSLYQDLRKKYPNPVVELEGETCTGCHLTLPSTVLKSVRKQESLMQCPNCKRLIFPK